MNTEPTASRGLNLPTQLYENKLYYGATLLITELKSGVHVMKINTVKQNLNTSARLNYFYETCNIFEKYILLKLWKSEQ